MAQMLTINDLINHVVPRKPVTLPPLNEGLTSREASRDGTTLLNLSPGDKHTSDLIHKVSSFSQRVTRSKDHTLYSLNSPVAVPASSSSESHNKPPRIASPIKGQRHSHRPIILPQSVPRYLEQFEPLPRAMIQKASPDIKPYSKKPSEKRMRNNQSAKEYRKRRKVEDRHMKKSLEGIKDLVQQASGLLSQQDIDFGYLKYNLHAILAVMLQLLERPDVCL